MSEPADTTEPGAEKCGSPNYILSQEEFHGSLIESEIRTQRLVRGEASSLVTTAGWVAVSLAFWLLLIGYSAITGSLRGRP